VASCAPLSHQLLLELIRNYLTAYDASLPFPQLVRSTIILLMLRETLSRILTEFHQAREQTFGGNATANFIRTAGRTSLQQGLGTQYDNLKCYASAGAGNWATVPWLAVFDPIVTTSATQGYYLVYLFSATEPVVYLSLNQGATAVKEEFKGSMYRVLQDRALLIVNRLQDFARDFDTSSIDLGSKQELPRGYVAGHAFGRRYDLHALPPEEKLQADLLRMVKAYLTLTYRGGLDPSLDSFDSSVAEDFDTTGLDKSQIVQETRRYKLHRRIERNSKGAEKAKAYHGTTCQACCFDFEKQYGSIGRNFIEAHHLKPLGQLAEGVVVDYDVVSDFAVLCANCHRMIHRTNDVGDLAGFKAMLSHSFCEPTL